MANAQGTDTSNLVEGIPYQTINPSNEAVAAQTGFRRMYVAALSALLYAVAMGMAASYTATATVDMQKRSSRVRPTDNEVSWIGSLLALGALFGGIAAGYISNKLGRKETLIISCFPLLFGWFCIAFARVVWLILIGRLLTGFSCGIIVAAAPPYLVEIATLETRGLLGSSFQLFATVGVLVANSIGSVLAWNLHAIAASSLSVIALAAMCLMPESPRWLVANGQYEKAIAAIKFLQGGNFDAEAECQSIREDLAAQPYGEITIQEFLKPGAYKPMLIATGLLFFQQFCGFNAILFYTVQILKDAKSPLEPNASAVIASGVLVMVTAISTFLMDKAGRKTLLLVSSGGMTVCLFVLGSFQYSKISEPWLTESYSWVPLLCIYTYIAAFSLGFCPVPWLMIPEISPLRLRSFIGGMSASICWAFFFIVTKTFEDMKSTLHDYGTYFLYGVFCILAFLFSLLCVKETKGKRFEEIQEMFHSPDDNDERNEAPNDVGKIF